MSDEAWLVLGALLIASSALSALAWLWEGFLLRRKKLHLEIDLLKLQIRKLQIEEGSDDRQDRH